jgi:hypothetical protein
VQSAVGPQCEHICLQKLIVNITQLRPPFLLRVTHVIGEGRGASTKFKNPVITFHQVPFELLPKRVVRDVLSYRVLVLAGI